MQMITPCLKKFILAASLLMFMAPQALWAKDISTHAALITFAVFAAGKSTYDSQKYNDLADNNKILDIEYQSTTSSRRRFEIKNEYSSNQDAMKVLKKQIEFADQITLAAVGIELFFIFAYGVDNAIGDNRDWHILPTTASGNAGIQFNWKY